MRQTDVVEGGEYLATVSGKRVRVRVLRISERYSAFQGRNVWSCVVRNLSTGREIDVRSPRRLTQVFSSSRVESMSNNNRFPSRGPVQSQAAPAVPQPAAAPVAAVPASPVMSREAILAALASQQIDTATALALLQALDATKQGKLTLKISEKGGLSLYGLGRWPTTLYRSQWQRLLEYAPTIQEFIRVNSAQLKDKE